MENVALLYRIAITSYWKNNTVWPFLVQHQGDDRYTKCTEHLHTLYLDNADCAYSTVECLKYVGQLLGLHSIIYLNSFNPIVW